MICVRALLHVRGGRCLVFLREMSLWSLTAVLEVDFRVCVCRSLRVLCLSWTTSLSLLCCAACQCLLPWSAPSCQFGLQELAPWTKFHLFAIEPVPFVSGFVAWAWGPALGKFFCLCFPQWTPSIQAGSQDLCSQPLGICVMGERDVDLISDRWLGTSPYIIGWRRVFVVFHILSSDVKTSWPHTWGFVIAFSTLQHKGSMTTYMILP